MLRLRSWMFVPGHSEKMIAKSMGLDLDVLMLDLEDGVVEALKAPARATVTAGLGAPAGGPLRYVRVNGTATPHLSLDLDAVVGPSLAGIVLPKVETIEQVRDTAASLDRLERERGAAAGTVRMMLAIESAKGIMAAPALAAASPRVWGLMFGAEDFSRDIGLPTLRTGRAREMIYARSAIIMGAYASGKMPIDGVWPDIRDADGLREDTLLARDLGFAGKSLIHPAQIAAINAGFSPSPTEVDFAQRLVADFETAVEAGHGSISFGGQLVDRPIYERARATLRHAESHSA